MPRSLLGRTFLLLTALVLITTTAWLSLFRYIDAEPRARETAQLATSAVNLIRAAIFAAVPEKRVGLLNELSTREGIRLLPSEPEERIKAMPDTRFMNLIRQELATSLGPHTRIAASVDDAHGFLVSFRFNEQDHDEYWLILPRERAQRSVANHWLTWGLLALSLALAVAWLIATRLSQPLKALAQAAATVGRGQVPQPLPESGPEEIRRLASAFNHMAADLQAHERDRSEVLAGISHDLRTPLTRLRLEAELSVADGARQAVVSDIEQMESIISQFMDYARGDQGEAAAPTDLLGLTQTLVDRQRLLGHPLTLQLPDALPELALRPKALTRALNNLLDNAWKYGGSEIKLKIQEASGSLFIEVCDNGPGIPEREAERLKRPFTRFEQARTNASGTGLGLAIVDRIARAHGGQLELLPNPAGGLIARIVLPISQSH
ncbi:MAG: ATP-binding protein [Rhodocyclaceae bacterium]|nr:ATP-binding protein [Rhodocyclaceae bacterium]